MFDQAVFRNLLHGDVNPKCASCTLMTVHAHRTIQRDNHAPHDPQAQPNPTGCAGIGIIQSCEIIKNMFSEFVRYANASISHPQFDPEFCMWGNVAIHLNGNLPTFCKFQSIVNKVVDDLANFMWVGRNKGFKVFISINRQLIVMHEGKFSVIVKDLINQAA